MKKLKTYKQLFESGISLLTETNLYLIFLEEIYPDHDAKTAYINKDQISIMNKKQKYNFKINSIGIELILFFEISPPSYANILDTYNQYTNSLFHVKGDRYLQTITLKFNDDVIDIELLNDQEFKDKILNYNANKFKI